MAACPGARAAALSLGLVLSAVAAAGCAQRETTVTTYTLTHQATRSWAGVRVEDVLRLWGQPAEKGSDGEGGTLLTYRTKSKVQVSTSVDEQGWAADRGQLGSGYPGMSTQHVETTEVPRAPSAVFYISPKGVVYRYTISAELLGSGKAPDPPLRDGSDAPARPPD
jgi:hypothetical protein